MFCRRSTSCCLAFAMASSRCSSDGASRRSSAVALGAVEVAGELWCSVSSCVYCLEGVCTGFVRVRGCASLLPFGRPRLTGGTGVGGSSSSSSDGGAVALCAIVSASRDSVSETFSIVGHAGLLYSLKFPTTPEYIWTKPRGDCSWGRGARRRLAKRSGAAKETSGGESRLHSCRFSPV